MSKFVSNYTKMYSYSNQNNLEKKSGYKSNYTYAYEKNECSNCAKKVSVQKKISNPNFIKVK